DIKQSQGINITGNIFYKENTLIASKMTVSNGMNMMTTNSPILPANTTSTRHLLGTNSTSTGLPEEFLLLVIYVLIATTAFLFVALLVVGIFNFSLRRKIKKLKDQLNLVLIMKKDGHKGEVDEKGTTAVKIVQDDLASQPRQSDHTSFKNSKKNPGVSLRRENECVKTPCQEDEEGYLSMGRPESDHVYEDEKWIQDVFRAGNKLPTVKRVKGVSFLDVKILKKYFNSTWLNVGCMLPRSKSVI
ncbi:unnamed protein product, partial [Meganyctiphanes norvegica]